MQTKLVETSLVVTTSWDDGHPSDHRVAELLEKHGLNGTFYVPCSNSEGRPVMSSGEIAELGQRFEIGGHTRDHINLTEVTPQVAASQIAYVRGRHNRIVRALVDKAGFRYARTIKNLMSAPGTDRLQVPTTTQFFAHTPATYLRNYISGGPTLQRAALLVAVLRENELAERCAKAAVACARSGGYFHLWGHSWELDEFNLWSELDRFLGQLREFHARFVTNAAWCASLVTRTEMPTAPVRASQEPAQPLSPARPTIR
jgi:peptidoglycan/xylan/chitin deacetylase (PgdA/CDA1 family)